MLTFASAVLDRHLECHHCDEAARRFAEAEATDMACIRPRDPRGARMRRACPCWTGRISHTRETRRYVVPVHGRVHSGFAGAQATSGPSRGRTKGSDHDAPSALLRTTSSALSTVLHSSIFRDSRALLPAFETGRVSSGCSAHVCNYSTLLKRPRRVFLRLEVHRARRRSNPRRSEQSLEQRRGILRVWSRCARLRGGTW
ncbi:hypothetical protein K466DRAFT_311546 [Polyporus arcularius HHB13444]|uniref:Uncharacterized protein n=1 Tax=Polyporus arcularius HHB13444 TaxID=1314778 RepID=A0A5C3NXV9_9APHY|nr:hypothetical protein K466DRAFT_311546 [Polyporus arcularius HHB13444]